MRNLMSFCNMIFWISGTLSTLEKVFGIRSRDTALLMAGNEISQILFIFAMPLVVKVKKRPFWTSLGLLCSALGLFLMAIPHWIKTKEEVIMYNLPLYWNVYT